MIVVGFEYSHAAWVIMLFDTRPDAEHDGEWNSYIGGNELAHPHWLEAGEINLEESITLLQFDGSGVELEPEAELAEPLGELVKTVLPKAKADGLFQSLPMAPGCETGVEHHEGA